MGSLGFPFCFVFYLAGSFIAANAAEWKFPIDSIKVKRHRSNMCMHIRGAGARCLNLTKAKPELEAVKALFQMTHHYDGEKLSLVEGPPPQGPHKQDPEAPASATGDDSSEEQLHSGGAPSDGDSQRLTYKDLGFKADDENMGSREVIEAERDFYRALYHKLLESYEKKS